MSFISCDQCFPVFRTTPGMRDHDRSADNVGDCKNLVHLFRRQALLMAFAQVVFNTVIATQQPGPAFPLSLHSGHLRHRYWYPG